MKAKYTKIPYKRKKVSITSSKNKNDNSSLRAEIVEYAMRFIGNPYVWGGTSLTKGADCSGFVQSVFKSKGIKLPRTSKKQAKGGKTVSIGKH